jgi:hypothetical protein
MQDSLLLFPQEEPQKANFKEKLFWLAEDVSGKERQEIDEE